MDVPLKVPDYTTLSRRQSKLEVELPSFSQNESRHLVIDSTGIKIFGEWEWNVRQHGYTKRRTWRKLHLGIDEETQVEDKVFFAKKTLSSTIVASVVTTNDVHDAQVFKDLLYQVEEPIHQVSADGAYDSFECYEQALERDAIPVIPPRIDAVINKESETRPEIAARNKTVKEVQKLGSKVWKKNSSYHRRSLAETAMFRIKILFGDHLKARKFESQAVEAFVRCVVLNRMTALGMPESCPI